MRRLLPFALALFAAPALFAGTATASTNPSHQYCGEYGAGYHACKLRYRGEPILALGAVADKPLDEWNGKQMVVSVVTARRVESVQIGGRALEMRKGHYPLYVGNETYQNKRLWQATLPVPRSCEGGLWAPTLTLPEGLARTYFGVRCTRTFFAD